MKLPTGGRSPVCCHGFDFLVFPCVFRFLFLNDLQADIVFLQETHLSKTSAHTLSSPQFPHMFSACYNSKQRGVAILINRKINFNINKTKIDPEGRFIIERDLRWSSHDQRA
uniref:Endonuclease/exonuclease/phosphatase domain-containing protein n=1 Tax=Amphilophus citrinellus TaxID=61819 RepID=A0A3Q0S610_AMPCI